MKILKDNIVTSSVMIDKEHGDENGYVGHFVYVTTIEVSFDKSITTAIVDISTAHRKPNLHETIIFLTHVDGKKITKGGRTIDWLVVDEWAKPAHGSAILTVKRWEKMTFSEFIEEYDINVKLTTSEDCD